jgi:hypothetical protein
VRRGRRFQGVTPEGGRVLAWARRVLRDLRGLEQEASRRRGRLEGTLRLGAIPTALPASTLSTTYALAAGPRSGTWLPDGDAASPRARHGADEDVGDDGTPASTTGLAPVFSAARSEPAPGSVAP